MSGFESDFCDDDAIEDNDNPLNFYCGDLTLNAPDNVHLDP